MERIRIASRFKSGLMPAMAFAILATVAGSAGPFEARAEEPKAAAGPRESDANAIRGLVGKYAKSIDDADTTLAAEIWSKSPDVSFIHPLGHERGWEQVKKNFYEKTMGTMLTERTLTPKDVVVHVNGESAWVEFYWDFSARLKSSGQPLKTKGRETQIYRKLDGRWELVHVHYSGMPVTERDRGF